MSKLIRIMQSYLVCALPFVLFCMGWSSYKNDPQVPDSATAENTFLKILWEILGWNLMIWFIVLILFLIMLVIVPEAREKTLKRLANIKERDEREQLITGKAARTAYISTLSLLIFLLFASVFSVNIYRAPESEKVNGKTGTAKIGLNFEMFDRPKVETNHENQVIFENKDIPLSKTGILLVLIVWQLAMFNLSARKQE